MVYTFSMSWEVGTVEDRRREFVALSEAGGLGMRALCRRFGVSAPTGYKWLARHKAGESLTDQPRRPKRHPRTTDTAVEEQVLAERAKHPTWGGRKLRRILLNGGMECPPSPSTITEILRRNDKLDGKRAGEPPDWQLFERAEPNELWQMDFKGHFPTLQERCHPLDVLDDCSRFNLTLQACHDESGPTVQAHLNEVFRIYGLPVGLLCDNGGPWGGHRAYTVLGVYLMRLGIRLYHGRPYHPQTQGKIERFHETLDYDLLRGTNWASLQHCQKAFDTFRTEYNHVRPHDSLDLDTPVSRYRVSKLAFPETLPPLEYASPQKVRIVQAGGIIDFHGRQFKVGKGLRWQRVGVSPTQTDGMFEVPFRQHPDMHFGSQTK